MKWTLLFVLAAVLSAGDVSVVRSVYLMPMSLGLDQFLAQRLTGQAVVQVVTDPMKADAIFTDRIGSNFEQSLAELIAVPKEKDKDGKVKDDTNDGFAKPSMQPLSRGKGNVFLVDRQSHEVIWSAFVTARNSDARELNHVADQVADQFAKARKKK